MTEADFQAGVVELARVYGWRVHHARAARTKDGWRTAITGDVGYPDLTLARRGRLLFVELKSEGGRVRAEQQAWLVALSACAEVFVWRPSDWPEIEDVLRRESTVDHSLRSSDHKLIPHAWGISRGERGQARTTPENRTASRRRVHARLPGSNQKLEVRK